MARSIEGGPREPEPNQEHEQKQEHTPKPSFQEFETAKYKPKKLTEEERKKIEESFR